MKARANKLFQDALEKLSQANGELYRPKEHLVTHSICEHAQFSIENFLKGYLLLNEIDPEPYTTLDALYKKCKTVNRNFNKIDLSAFNCSSENINSRYCHEVSKVCRCLHVAGSLKILLEDEQIIKKPDRKLPPNPLQ